MRCSPTIFCVAVTAFLSVVQPAHAARFSSAVMQRCADTVGQMKFDGWPADRNRDMMMRACQANGGTIPGSQG